MTATRPLRAGLIGALLGGIGPLLLSCAAVAGFWIFYVGPGFAGEHEQAVAGLIVLAVLTLGALIGLWWTGARSLRAAGSPSPASASAVGIAVPIGTAVVVADPAPSVWVFAVVVAVSGAVTWGYAAAVGGRLGLVVAVLLGLIAGLGPTAVLAAIYV